MASVFKRPWTHNGQTKEAWVVRYKDGTGAYRQKTFQKKKDADGYRAKVELDLRSGDHIAPGQSKTVAAAAKLLLEHVDAQAAIGSLRPCTARNYHSAFRQAILPFIGDKLVLDVKPQDLEAWYHRVIREDRMTPTSAYRRLWFVREMFKFAIRRRWCGHNPAEAAMKSLGKPRERKIETFDIAAVRRVVATADVRSHKARERSFQMTRLAVHLAAFCGLRWGEVFGLTLDHVDLPRGLIRIRHSLDGLGNLQEPKTRAGNRTIALPRHIVDMLTAFIAAWPVTNNSRLVFASHNGTPMRAANFHKSAWTPLLSRADVATKDGRGLHFHALRHFACSWMIENGWPITDVSATLGHENVSITLQVYAHTLEGRSTSPEAMQKLAEKLLVEQAPAAPLALPAVTRLTHETEAADFIEV